MPKRILEGNVVGDKTDKTITVRVERRFMHPLYKKYVRKSSKYTAHDENNQFKAGDRVRIIECRPVSKTKRWEVLVGDAPVAKTDKKAEKPAAKKADPKKETAKKETAKKTAPKKEASKKETAKKPAAKKAAPKKETAKKETKKTAAKKPAAKKKTDKKDK